MAAAWVDTVVDGSMETKDFHITSGILFFFYYSFCFSPFYEVIVRLHANTLNMFIDVLQRSQERVEQPPWVPLSLSHRTMGRRQVFLTWRKKYLHFSRIQRFPLNLQVRVHSCFNSYVWNAVRNYLSVKSNRVIGLCGGILGSTRDFMKF